MPATLTDRPADLARQLTRLAELLAGDGCLLTSEAERELGLPDAAAGADAPASDPAFRERTANVP